MEYRSGASPLSTGLLVRDLEQCPCGKARCTHRMVLVYIVLRRSDQTV